MTQNSSSTDLTALNLVNHHPDVLNTLANLSNDEVFTPPEFVNKMLDTLEQAWAEGHRGANIWSDPSVRFIDPFTKSGSFLREITRRLSQGLEDRIPNLEKRVDHILTKQVFGISITRLTALLSRRSVYCSKDATGRHSVAKSFRRHWGNIWFEPVNHTWVGGKDYVTSVDETGKIIRMPRDGRCKYCGASQVTYDRGPEYETHAYGFIHTDDIQSRVTELFGANMHFDVIIGNPPYQLSDGGYGISALPIYQHFVQQAKKLEPRYLSMVTPSRWMTGGKGLDKFREDMLSDSRIRYLADYPDSNDVFPGTQIKGGVSFWLWDRDNPGDVEVETYDKGQMVSAMRRPLREPGAKVFIRYNPGVSILRKVMEYERNKQLDKTVFELPEDKQFKRIVSPRRPFGFSTTFKGHTKKAPDDLLLHRNGGKSYVPRAEVSSSHEVIDQWKVFIARAGSGSDAFPHPILSRPFVGKPGEVSSETYIYIGPFENEDTCLNVMSYLHTRFLRFLVLLHKPSQSTTREQYTFVPLQDFSRPWTDEDLYEKYGINDVEIEFIESMVRPMEDAVE